MDDWDAARMTLAQDHEVEMGERLGELEPLKAAAQEYGAAVRALAAAQDAQDAAYKELSRSAYPGPWLESVRVQKMAHSAAARALRGLALAAMAVEP